MLTTFNVADLSPHLDYIAFENLSSNSLEQEEDDGDHTMPSLVLCLTPVRNNLPLIHEIISKGPSVTYHIALPLKPVLCHLIHGSIKATWDVT